VSSARKIRVGIIRCDTHAFWYAPLFEAPDPEAYRKVHRGCHYYFYEPDNPKRLKFRTVPGMTIAKVYDAEDRTKAEHLSEAYGGRPVVCDSFEQVSDDVDLVYIADCNYEGKDHLRLATPGLEKGVPHFVDKPFAFTLGEARAMLALAEKHGTAVMCCSLLRQSPYLERFRVRFKDIAPVNTVLVPCYGPSLAGVFHGLSSVQSVMGEGCEWVESMGPERHGVVRLHYPKQRGRSWATRAGTDAIVLTTRGEAPEQAVTAANYGHCANYVSGYGGGGSIHSPRVDDFSFPLGGQRIVKMAREMALTGKPPIAYASMLELMEMVEASRLARKKGKLVRLEEVR
jgi:Oxidoreductase family, NAD-binding Rossmann fold